MLQQANIRPRYEVEKIEGTVREAYQTIEFEAIVDDQGQPIVVNGKPKRRIKRVVAYKEVPYGYNVYMPNGNSLRVRTPEDLVRLKLVGPAAEVDMETGEIIPKDVRVSLKDLHAQKEKRNSHSRRRTLEEEGDD